STVLDSYLGPYIKSWKPRLSPLLALCVFLACERHLGEASDWFPYIDVLPVAYACPAYFADDVVALLPSGVRRRALEQREAVLDIHSSHRRFFRSLQPILSQPVDEVLTYEALRWAWCSVNTRSVFMSHPPNDSLSGPDVYALAPFLDLLNHRPDVQVKASFNDVTGCYEIGSVSGTLRYQQAFINYGCHDNQRLMLEYGFVAPGNPDRVVYVDADLLCDILRGDGSLDQKIKFLKENKFLHNLTVSSEGPSWRLMTALRLLSLPQTLYHLWKAVLLGQVQCEEREEWSVQTISRLLLRCDQPVREQLDVVKSLRQEERCILGSCLEALEGPARRDDMPT
uniref:SET domain containing 4 n=1 Tax=Cyclopterus lumpus TaxID=8103 RepID=A0A8C2X8D8_CYCLU